MTQAPASERPIDPRPPAGAPDVVIIVLDDTGFAHLGCFGSDIATPNIDGLAARGLRYNRFHVTALCSPTRACVLTGRNHHAVGVGFLVDLPMAYPGYNCRIPASAVPLPRVLGRAGYSTMAVGKWHLVPRGERGVAGPFDRWPLGYGFDRYYGFLQGDTNQWTPNLVRDNGYVDPPRRPEEGYHLSEDLVDQAIGFVVDQQHSAPGKPYFMLLAFGATHAPHQVRPEWSDPYRGRFDQGWDRWREEVFARQVESGIVPAGTVLTPRPSWVAGWDDLGADERRMHARQQEVFAGFLTHTDAQIGRFLDFLAAVGRLDNTLVMVMSDNGASAEGGVHGTFNEHRFTAQLPETVEDNLAELDEWGGFRSYNHYSWAWAWAGNTPMRLWKRYTWLGGTRTPLIVAWPRRITGPGAVRSQFCHAIDLMPTVLDACGVEPPTEFDGAAQSALDGRSLLPTLADASAPELHATQYFEMLGSRSIYHQGWKATTDHVSQGVRDEELLMVGSRDFATDEWALFRLDDDFSEARDLAAEHPDLVAELRDLWTAQAERNQVFPLVGELVQRFQALIGAAYPPPARAVFRPGGTPVPDEAVPLIFGGFTITAEVDVPPAGGAGVVCAEGDWTGGMAMYVHDGHLVFALRPGGELVRIVGTEPVPAGHQLLTVTGEPGAPVGCRLRLFHGAREVAAGEFTQNLPVIHQHGGTALCLGFDRGFPVTDDYFPPSRWNGTLHQVVVEGRVTPPVATPHELRTALRAD
ncbi:MAG TPA: arylsulfatase [Acidimicrobiales bacterium]|nr:arylsulfatase [Acidimicrobiales bacterium]